MNDKFNTENEDNMEKEKKSKIKKILVYITYNFNIFISVERPRCFTNI